jgi:hypothetical protein
MEPIAEFQRYCCMYNSVELVQVVRTEVVASGGLYIATSADVPTMYAAAFDLVALRDAIEDSIHGYFHALGDKVEVQFAGRHPEDLSTWHVTTLSEGFREAAE